MSNDLYFLNQHFLSNLHIKRFINKLVLSNGLLALVPVVEYRGLASYLINYSEVLGFPFKKQYCYARIKRITTSLIKIEK